MNRKTGVVVPLSALYTKESGPIGDFLSLKPFADFCSQANLSVIQLLPVNDTGTQSSPYSGLSAFALHPVYIRINALPEFAEAYEHDRSFASAYRTFIKMFKYSPRFNYESLSQEKIKLLHLLYYYIEKTFTAKGKKPGSNINPQDRERAFYREIDAFVENNRWVIPYAVYKNLKDDHFQATWKSWEEEKRLMTMPQIQQRWANKALRSTNTFFVWCQMRAAEQFRDAADYIRKLNIILKGDIPILMNEDSADCWSHPEYFRQELRAGSPPDAENPTGQYWGFPTYNWDGLAKDGYSWWKDRIKCAAQYYDAFRIDHILGFFRIWAVKEHDSTAYLGRTDPYVPITREALHENGFDDGRIKWLSQPHIQTSELERITGSYDEACQSLSIVCDRLGNEELWNFKQNISTDADIFANQYSTVPTKDASIKDVLSQKWLDRSLIQTGPDTFTAVWRYADSTAWHSLNGDEQDRLRKLFESVNRQQENLWKEHALKVLEPIVKASSMQPCAEDLGVHLESLPEVLKRLDIYSLKVIRWNRRWEAEKQPYVFFEDYPFNSVTTTSVHDSSTLRQWWNQEKDSVRAYLSLWNEEIDGDEAAAGEADVPKVNADDDFSPEAAALILGSGATSNSAWYINPLQDYLYLDKAYYLEDMDNERINVPGSVSDFNWTYRMPVTVEQLQQNELLIKNIKNIANIHDIYTEEA